jgi:hypothetical protein
MILDIAFINGVSVAETGDDPESWQVQIDTEELGTHSTVLLRLSLQNSAILRDAIDRKLRIAQPRIHAAVQDVGLWSRIFNWYKRRQP